MKCFIVSILLSITFFSFPSAKAALPHETSSQAEDFKRAHQGIFRWFKESVEQGLPQYIPLYLSLEIQYGLARIYYEDRGAQKNSDKAFDLLEDLAKKGYAPAQFSLSLMFLFGTRIKDDGEAFHWMEQAQEQGLLEAQHYLALMYYGGRGTEKDFTKAF